MDSRPRVQAVARCELTNTHANQRTNKHDGSQYLLEEDEFDKSKIT